MLRSVQFSSLAVFLLLSFLVGCNGPLPDPNPDASDEGVEFVFAKSSLASIAIEDSVTVSAHLFSTQDTLNLQQGQFGQYFSLRDTLVPGNVLGGSFARQQSYGLRGVSGLSYVIAFVSPATQLSPIGSTGRYGIPYRREMSSRLYFSGLKTISLVGLGYQSANGRSIKYSYAVGELKEAHSKIRLTISCDQTLDSVSLRSVSVRNLLASGWYLPQTGRFYHDPSLEVYESDTIPDFNSVVIRRGGSLTSAVTSDIYAMSQDYSSVDANMQPSNPVPRLVLTMAGSNGEDLSVMVPLNDNFPSQSIMHYRINIKSRWVLVRLTVLPWDAVPSDGDVDDQPTDGLIMEKDSWIPISDEGVIQ